MTDKSKTAEPAAHNPEVLDVFNTAIAQASDRGSMMFGAGLEEWSKEGQRFYDEMSTQGFAALEQLKHCKSPVDLLKVEQDWFAARTKSCLESGLRIAHALTGLGQPAKAPTPRSSATA